MVRIIVILSIIFLSKAGIGQSGYEVIIDTDRESYIGSAKEDEQGNMYFVGYQFMPTTTLANSIVVKVDPNGEATTKILDYGDTLCGLRKLIVLPDQNIMAFGAIGVTDSVYSYKKYKNFWVLKLNESLDLIYDKRYEVAGDYWSPFYEPWLMNDSLIYAVGNCHWWEQAHRINLFTAIFNTDGDTLHVNYPFIEDPYNGHGEIQASFARTDSTGITAYGGGFVLNAEFNAIDFDMNLDYSVTLPSLPQNFVYHQESLKPLNNGDYLFATTCYAYKGQEDIMVLRMNESHQYKKYITMGRADTSDYCGWRQAIDYVHEDKVYVGWQLKHMPDDAVNSKVFVYMMDTALNIKGLKYYGGYMNYALMTVTATSDGGCVLGGTVYDWQNSFPEDVDLWIKKLFPEDLITHAEDTPDPKDGDVWIGPNPGREYLNVHTLRDHLVLNLYDMNGRLVLNEKISNFPYHRVATNMLKSGSYTFQVTDIKKGVVIEKGVWIKE